jgi:hypothetical protein
MFHRHYGLTLKAADAMVWLGNITLEEIQLRARCSLCGHRGARVSVSCSTPMDAKMGLG